MTGLTAEKRKKLDNLLFEYGNSLTRVDNEKAQMKAMEELVKSQLEIEPKHFRVLAKALWEDSREKTKKDIETQLDLFLLYDPPDPIAKSSEDRDHRKTQVAIYQAPGSLQ